MSAEFSTITIRVDVKERLAALKGKRSWDVFLSDVADGLPVDDAIAELELRLAGLRSHKVEGVSWRAVKAKRHAKAGRK